MQWRSAIGSFTIGFNGSSARGSSISSSTVSVSRVQHFFLGFSLATLTFQLLMHAQGHGLESTCTQPFGCINKSPQNRVSWSTTSPPNLKAFWSARCSTPWPVGWITTSPPPWQVSWSTTSPPPCQVPCSTSSPTIWHTDSPYPWQAAHQMAWSSSPPASFWAETGQHVHHYHVNHAVKQLVHLKYVGCHPLYLDPSQRQKNPQQHQYSATCLARKEIKYRVPQKKV